MENYKITFSNDKSVTIRCDKCEYNNETDEMDIIVNGEIVLSAKPVNVDIQDISPEPVLAAGYILEK